MAVPPTIVRSSARPANPVSGGHYVPIQGGWQLIHAVGPGQWAPGPRTTPLPTRPAPAPRPVADPNLQGQYANPLYRPMQTLYGKPLANAVQALTNVQYDPAINQLKQQIAQATTQGTAAQKATAGYFNTLGQYAQNAADRVNAIGAGLNTTLQGIGQGAQSALDVVGQQAAAPALQNLAAQGLGGGATDQLAAQIAGLKGAATARSQAAQDYGTQIGANASTLAAQNLGAYALRGQERLGQIANATQLALQPTETQLATKISDKAAAYATNLMSARQAERNYAVTQAGLNLKNLGIQTTAATAAANRQQTARNVAAQITGANQRNQANIDARALQGNLDRASRERIATANRNAANARAAGKQAAAAGKPANPAAQRVMWNQITGIQGRVRYLVNTIQSWPGSRGLGDAQNQAYNALKTGRLYVPQYDKQGKLKGYAWQTIPVEGDIPMLNVAFNSALPNRALSPGDVAYLHSLGFTIGNLMPTGHTITLPAQAPATRTSQGTGMPPVLPAGGLR